MPERQGDVEEIMIDSVGVGAKMGLVWVHSATLGPTSTSDKSQPLVASVSSPVE